MFPLTTSSHCFTGSYSVFMTAGLIWSSVLTVTPAKVRDIYCKSIQLVHHVYIYIYMALAFRTSYLLFCHRIHYFCRKPLQNEQEWKSSLIYLNLFFQYSKKIIMGDECFLEAFSVPPTYLWGYNFKDWPFFILNGRD